MSQNDLAQKWFKSIVRTPRGTFNKYDVYAYYQSVKPMLLNDIRGNPVIVIRHMEPDKVFLQRNVKDRKIEITQSDKSVDSPKDFRYWIERRATEFHKTFPKHTDEIAIDIDPEPPVARDKVTRVVRTVYSMLKTLPNVQSVKLRYSGGRGFYVIAKLKSKEDINTLRANLRSHLGLIRDKYITFSKPSPGEIRIDFAPLKEGGSIRAAYSLNTDYGYVAVPVTLNMLDKFNPEMHAAPERFIKTKVPVPIRLED